MRTITLLFTMLTFSLVSSAQVIQLKFSAHQNGTPVNIDSVRITNLTQPGEMVLHWPDTSFIMGYVGVPDVAGNNISSLGIRLCSENPVYNQALIQLSLPTKCNIVLRVSDITGRILHEITMNLSAGRHFFNYSPSTKGVSIISASSQSQVKSLKIIYAGQSNGCDGIDYMGEVEKSNYPKSLSSILSFGYSIGDSLLLDGWYNGSDTSFFAAPQASANYSFNFTLSNACPGLPSFSYGGQIYTTVQIGTQCMMRENLNIGTYVPSITTGNIHSDVSNNGIIEKYCYNNDQANCAIYGGLYDWEEMMQYNTTPGIQGICPPGWHIPTNAEWDTLVSFLGGSLDAGCKMKETGFSHWGFPNAGATNESGFAAFGAGYRLNYGDFNNLQNYADFWSSSQVSYNSAWERSLNFYDIAINQNSSYKTLGNSLRCFKD